MLAPSLSDDPLHLPIFCEVAEIYAPAEMKKKKKKRLGINEIFSVKAIVDISHKLPVVNVIFGTKYHEQKK